MSLCDYVSATGGDLVEQCRVHGIARGITRPHFHAWTQITVMTRGWREIWTPFQIWRVEAGEVLVVPPGVAHQFVGGDAMFDSVNFYVDPGEVQCLGPEDSLARDLVILSPNEPDTLVTNPDWPLIRSILRPAESRLHRRDRLDRCVPPNWRAAANALTTAPWTQGDIAVLAARFEMSAWGFIRGFKRWHGLPPYRYALNHRLNESKSLISAGMPIVEVAAALGFSDQSHFGRLFKSFFGTTPGRYQDLAAHQKDDAAASLA